MKHYAWSDWQTDESTDDIVDKYVITIELDGEEFATIVHRTCGGLFPLDGPLARQKERDAEAICDAMNRTETEGQHD